MKISISSFIALIIIFVSIALTSLNAFVVIKEGKTAAIDSAEVLFKEISSTIIGKINLITAPISTLTCTSANKLHKISSKTVESNLYKNLHFMKNIVDANNNLMSVYIGYDNGFFYQFFSVRGDHSIMETYKAPSGTQYIDRAITLGGDGNLQQHWRFLDANLIILSDRLEHEVTYDPRTRPWYINAKNTGETIFTAPYVFSSSKLPGITSAQALSDGGGVFGADVSLAQLGDILASEKVTENGIVWILDKSNRLVAFPGLSWSKTDTEEFNLPEATASSDARVRGVANRMKSDSHSTFQKPFILEIDGIHFMALLAPSSQQGLELVVAITAPLDDITGHITRLTIRSLVFSIAFMLMITPLAIFLAERTSSAFTQLVEETDRIQKFDFSESPAIQSHIQEINSLAEGVDSMKSTIRKNTEKLIDTQDKLKKLVEGGLALSAENDMAKLVTLIFQIAKNLANADGGVLYLLDGDVLEVELLSISSESLILGGLSDNPAPRVMVKPAIMAFLAQNTVLRWACEAFNRRDIVAVHDVELTLFPTGLPEKSLDYPIKALIAVPIVTRQQKVIGVIQLFNSRDKETGEFIGSERKDVNDFISSLAAQAAITLDNRNLIKSLRDIFDSMIQVIAAAIDSKSHYTGGHCTRVPLLVEMLAKALHDSEEEPFKNFRLESEDEWRELHIAAWMHDCGKVTTPEYVVDKATKLETIYNRIHEVRMRFEVLHRDAEIDYYRKLATNETDALTLQQKLEDELKKLEDDFAFVATCNVGGEFMSDGHKERLKQIAERTWLRHYSDRIGISDEELRLKSDLPEVGLPAQEHLLADKPQHIVPRKKMADPIRDPQGNIISIPENEYNRGEIYNLCISRGTLTAEERHKINEHVLNGFEMLKKIPFPESMGRVSEIATSHHETLSGTGYPFHKTEEQISTQARILTVADIFEALTATDRPYAKAKTLSEVLKIMTFMRKDRHIDPDIFRIFLKSNVFREYAERYLLPSQLDVDDISPYL